MLSRRFASRPFAFRNFIPLFVLALVAGNAQGAVEDPTRLLPESTVFCLGIERPGLVLDVATDESYLEKLSLLAPVGKALRSPQMRQVGKVVELLEARLGTSSRKALPDLLGGGVWLAYDGQTQAIMLIVRPKNTELLEKLLNEARTFIDDTAVLSGKESPVKSKEHAGAEAYSFGPGEFHAQVDGLLLFANQNDALRGMLDRRADASLANLSTRAEFGQARRQAASDALAWSALDLAALRKVNKVEQALGLPSPNPLLEIIAGGLLDSAAKAPWLAASLVWQDQQLRLRVGLPYDASKVAAPRRWFFTESGSSGGAASPLHPKQMLASLSLYRDFSKMWLAREELFDEKVNAGLTQADTNLGLYFSGKDFGPEVLGELTPRWQFVAARRTFSAGQPIPALKLPAMALVMEVKSDEMAQQLLLSYQNMIAIINLTGIQSGRPQLLISADVHDGVKVVSANFVVPPGGDKDKARIEYNFQPACARVGSRFIIGSTGDFVRELVSLPSGSPTSSSTSDNSILELDGSQIRAAFIDNRDMLVSRAMLSSGGDREEAAQQIDAALELGKYLRSGSLRLVPSAEALVLEATLGIERP